VEHAGFDRIARNAENRGGLLHRFSVIVDEIDDLAMSARQAAQAVAHDFPAVLDRKACLRIVGRIARLRGGFVAGELRPAPQLGQRLVAGDC
jgi:hypothetical protein